MRRTASAERGYPIRSQEPPSGRTLPSSRARNDARSCVLIVHRRLWSLGGRPQPMADFTHLHLHTQYSFLDGAIHMPELAPRIKELGMSACATTEHGNLFGAIDFYKRAKDVGIKAILGCEAYVAKEGRLDRTSRRSHHLVLLAKNNE